MEYPKENESEICFPQQTSDRQDLWTCRHFRPYFSISSFYTHSYNLARTLPPRNTPSFLVFVGNGQGRAELQEQGALWGSTQSRRQVFPKEEAQPSSVFTVGLRRQSGRVQDRIVSAMVNATPYGEYQSHILLFSCIAEPVWRRGRKPGWKVGQEGDTGCLLPSLSFPQAPGKESTWPFLERHHRGRNKNNYNSNHIAISMGQVGL